MKVELEGKTFTITGRLENMTKAQATTRLKAAGAKVTKSLAVSTDYLVAGFRPGEKEEQARLRGIPVLTEQQLEQVLEGETVRAKKQGTKRKKKKKVDQSEVIGKFRELLTESADWKKICAAFDRLSPEDATVAGEYVAAHFEAQAAELHARSYGRLGMRYGPVAPLQASPEWVKEILAGQDHPKLQIVMILNLYDQKMAGKVAKQLFACTHLHNVRLLDLSRNKLPMGFYKELGAATQFGKVTYLRLENNPLTDKAARGLSQGALEAVRHLDLHWCNMDKGGVIDALFGAGAWSSLRILDITQCRLRSQDLQDLAAATQLTQLEELDCGDNRFDEDSMRAFLQAPQFAQLQRLNLRSNKMDPWLGQALAQATQLDNLRQLNLSYNNLDDSSVRAIAEAEHLQSLEDIDISDNRDVSAAGVQALLHPNLPNLRRLSVPSSELNDDFALALAEATHLTKLEELSLYYAQFTARGWEALTQAEHLKQLRQISISQENIPADCRTLINKAPHWSNELKQDLRS